MSRGSKYSDQQRKEAVREYAACGCLATVSESIGIPKKTLGDWFRSNWWNQLAAELRPNDGELELASGEVSEVTETKIGRPTAYKPTYAKHALRLCLLGATDEELADFFEVSQTTVDNWKKKHPDFLGSLRQGKIEADSRVAQGLYARAIGYEHAEEKIMHYQGEVIRVSTTKRYPPDTQAIGLWLKNRRSHQWRDERHMQLDAVHQTAVVMLPPDLVEKMNRAAGLVIEGECEQIEDGGELVGPDQP